MEVYRGGGWRQSPPAMIAVPRSFRNLTFAGGALPRFRLSHCHASECDVEGLGSSHRIEYSLHIQASCFLSGFSVFFQGQQEERTRLV
jgi:hypothetical protein